MTLLEKHNRLISNGWKLAKLVGSPVGLIGIKNFSYRVYRKPGKDDQIIYESEY